MSKKKAGQPYVEPHLHIYTYKINDQDVWQIDKILQYEYEMQAV